MKLWFENANGDRRVIKDPCNTWEDVNKAIDEFIANCNANKHKIAKERYGENYDPKKVIPFELKVSVTPVKFCGVVFIS